MNNSENIDKKEVNDFLFNSIIDNYAKLEIAPIQKNLDLINFKESNSDNNTEDDAITIFRLPKSTANEIQLNKDFQFICTIDGSLNISIGKDSAEIPEQSILLIPHSTPYAIEYDGQSTVITIHVPLPAMKLHLNRVIDYNTAISSFISSSIWSDSTESFIVYNNVDNVNICKTIDLMINESLNRTQVSNSILIFLLLALIGYLSAIPEPSCEVSKHRVQRKKQLTEIIRYINDNYKTVSLQTLSKEFHYTVPYLSKLIRESTGMRFTQLIRGIRHDMCTSLLATSNMKINKIAELAGYQSTDHFNRVFKKRTGMTPTEYRNSHKEKND